MVIWKIQLYTIIPKRNLRKVAIIGTLILTAKLLLFGRRKISFLSFININFNQKKAPKGAFCIVVEILCKSVVDCSSQNDNKKGILRLPVFVCPSQNDNSDSHTEHCHTERSEVSRCCFYSLSKPVDKKGITVSSIILSICWSCIFSKMARKPKKLVIPISI